MNLEKFTDRAKGFLQAAQTVAIRMSHQRIGPEHVLKALLEDNEGMASGLIRAAGGDPAVALKETDDALAKVPSVSGSGDMGLSPDRVTRSARLPRAGRAPAPADCGRQSCRRSAADESWQCWQRYPCRAPHRVATAHRR